MTVRVLRRLLLALILAAAALLVWTVARTATTLDLGDTPGPFTGHALVRLRDEPARCRTLLDRAGVRYTRLAPRREGPHCGYADGLRLDRGGALGVALSPADPPLACPVAAALATWQWSVVQPAARRYLGTPVVAIEQLGSYNCRHIAGSPSWSEHATADALDIAGFRLADGRRLTVLGDWRGTGPEATFLHQVRAGACKLFATVLSPDYNAAHRDHLHLDQAARGDGWGACR